MGASNNKSTNEDDEQSWLDILKIIGIITLLILSLSSCSVMYLQSCGIIPDIFKPIGLEDKSRADPSVLEPYYEVEKVEDAEVGDNLVFNEELISDDYNTFIGYGEVWVSKEQPTVPFVNDSTNTSYAKYRVYSGNELLYETELIAPGSHIDWDAYEALQQTGKYNLIQKCQFYSPIYKDSQIYDFTLDGVSISNDNFTITVR